MATFIEPETIITTIAGSVLLVSLLVAGRFLLCSFRAFQERKYGALLLAAAGCICSIVVVAAVFTVWFGYAVAHTHKDISTDLRMCLYTIPPYFVLQYLLWFGGGKLAERLRTDRNN